MTGQELLDALGQLDDLTKHVYVTRAGGEERDDGDDNEVVRLSDEMDRLNLVFAWAL